MPRARWWVVLVLVGSSCGVRFAACEPQRPVEYLPVKLWSCTAMEKRCEVYARFKTTMDCALYQQMLRSECEPDTPPGVLQCRETTNPAYLNEWFSECAKGDLTFNEVRDDPGRSGRASFPVDGDFMGYFYVAISPCQFTAEQRRQTEHDYPGLRFPDEGRLPSRRDFEAIFASRPEWQVVFDQRANWWTADVHSANRSASIRVDKYSGDPAREQEFYFESGDPELVLAITDAVAERCGPFLIAGEGGDIVVLVNQDGSRSDVGETPAGGSRPA